MTRQQTELDSKINQIESKDELDNDINFNEILTEEYIENYTKKINKKTSQKPVKIEKKAGQRRTVKNSSKNEDKNNLNKLIPDNIPKEDVPKILKKAKETVNSIEDKAKEIEKSKDFSIDLDKYNNNLVAYQLFLYDDTLHSITSNGIDLNLYINHYNLLKYNWSNGPDSSLIIDVPTQLVLVHKLNRLFNFQFIQQTDTSIKFNDLDRSVCCFIKENLKETYKFTYDLLKHLLKKILVVSMTNVEFAFRSDKIWMSPNFKKFILSDVIMMESLQGKLKQSFKIFIESLTQIKNGKVFNNIKIIDKLLHTVNDLELEEILGNALKCMTPCFILDYFNSVKSIYLFMGLLNIYIYKKQLNEYFVCQKEDLDLICKIVNIIYQNTRLYQNTTGRQLPSYTGTISEETQMYYLNHTIVGPQFILLKLLERSCVSIWEYIK